MAIREDLVASAVTFLQDPSVAAAPLDKRVAFLQSKNLTQEEIDASLARAGDSSGPAPGQSNYGYPNQQMIRQSAPPQYGYGYQGGYWPQQQPPPPEVPRRDWRDYFIMATVMSGLSYGVYFVAKRYIAPIIAPPTPPQLEQDKASIDESFKRAFDLIEQLSNDTATIKASEEARKDRLDSSISDFESAIQELKDASKRRDEDTRRISDEVRALQAMIPKAMKAQEEVSDQRLQDLNRELKSLKTLIASRMGGGVASTVRSAPSVNGANISSTSYPSPSANDSGSTTPTSTNPANMAAAALANAASTQGEKSNAASGFNRFSSGKGGIPAWQLAASKRQEQDAEKADTSQSGTAVDATSPTPEAS